MKRKTLSIILCLFVLLAFASHLSPFFQFDLQVSRWLQLNKPEWFSEYMKFISIFGNYKIMPIFIGALFSGLIFLGLRIEAAISLIFSVISLIANSFIKTIVNRPRPDPSLVTVYTNQFDKSFPSGHTMTYTIVFGYIFFLILKNKKIKPLLKILLLSLTSLPILTIGISRIFLGVHWMSDVLGGYLMGGIGLYFMISYYQKLNHSRNKNG